MQVLELEEQQSARWWREEEGLLSVRDTEQRTRHLQHLLKCVGQLSHCRCHIIITLLLPSDITCSDSI